MGTTKRGNSVSTGDYDIEPHEMSVLANKFDSVTRDMTQSLLKSARSGVIAVARDFSSAICLYDGRQFVFDEGIPVHTGNIGSVPEYTLEHFDDIEPGDAFLNNSPYSGNSHHADYTLHVPVFYEGEPLFWTVNRAHQADCGAPEPTTYPDAEDMYKEGPHFPSVKIQRDYEDIDHQVRMVKLNVRVGEQWYGDYKAQVSAVRTGEDKIHEIIDEYGVETVKRFRESWLDYSEAMMETEIEGLEATEIRYTSYHDPLPKEGPDPIKVHVRMEIQPEESKILVDVTENQETIPSGFNLSEATTKAAIYSGIFFNVSSDVPHNEGALRCIDVELDEGKIVGQPDYPRSAAIATTNVCGALYNATQAAFGQLGEPYGIAEGAPNGQPPNLGVISGEDFRRDDEPFVNQIFMYGGGAPALHGHDGWDTYLGPGAAGMLNIDSVEVLEQKYPIQFERTEFLPDTEGSGTWRGTPAFVTEYSPRENEMSVNYLMGASQRGPRGILGGESGAPSEAYKITEDGHREDLPVTSIEVVDPGEVIGGVLCGGGGYGPPEERDPVRVREDVERGLITVEGARENYGVAIVRGEDGYEVDKGATEALRETATEGNE